MSTTRASNWLARWGKAAAAGLMLLLWLYSFALAVSPELHDWLHPDANGPEHHCVVTQIQQSHLLAPITTVAVTISIVVVCSLCPVLFDFVSDRDHRLSPSRAPPFRFSPQLVVG